VQPLPLIRQRQHQLHHQQKQHHQQQHQRWAPLPPAQAASGSSSSSGGDNPPQQRPAGGITGLGWFDNLSQKTQLMVMGGLLFIGVVSNWLRLVDAVCTLSDACICGITWPPAGNTSMHACAESLETYA
jgi:hypothetical protein